MSRSQASCEIFTVVILGRRARFQVPLTGMCGDVRSMGGSNSTNESRPSQVSYGKS